MEKASFTKSVEDWLVELNNPNAKHRRDVLIALADSGTLDDRLINELRFIARGDPDIETRSLAKQALKLRGIEIFPQVINQPGVKPTNLLRSLEFWIGFALCSILNLFIGPLFLLILGGISIVLQLSANIALLVYFGLTRKNVALGMLAGFVFVILPICWALYRTFNCWPDGCGG
jgi:hypothetical protein